MPLDLAAYVGPSSDRSLRGGNGALRLAEAIAATRALTLTTIGTPPLDVAPPAWHDALAAARPDLEQLSCHTRAALDAGRTPVTCLPRCSAALGTVPAVMTRWPDAHLVWFDAHADLNTPDTSLSGYLGGMTIAGAAGEWDTGLDVRHSSLGRSAFDVRRSAFEISRVVLVGLRDADPPEEAMIAARQPQVIAVADDMALALARAVEGRPVYVHLDVDVLDAGLAPSDFSVDGGLSWRLLRETCEVLARQRVVGVEFAELDDAWPDGRPFDPAPLLHAIAPLLDAMGAPVSSSSP